jgi:multiple antibiotic resistance protein
VTNGPADTELSLSMVFTAFFVMLGPEKLIHPFGTLTSGISEAEARGIASKALLMSCVGGLVAAVIGGHALHAWALPHPVLRLAGGLILLLVALQAVLAQYEPGAEHPTGAPTLPPHFALAPLTFPIILSPHGIAAVVLLLGDANDAYRTATIAAFFLVVMGLNWLVMWFARPIMRRGGVVLTMLGPILAVLQVALAIKMMLGALRSLHVLPGE